jgi:uncharacterized circularly permuted ATP-grasp superfamily protein/uncharacterized alpha-E superfamily protein
MSPGSSQSTAPGDRIDLAAAAPAAAGHFDELRDATGQIRPPWQAFAARAGDLSALGLEHAARRIARQVDENGITYTVYDAGDSGRRPWALDALPLLIPAAEWEGLEPGLRQIGRVMNALAADLYGARHLVREGLVPPALVFAHRGFLRACQGVTPAGGVFLHTLAIDLARSPEGRWMVAHARTQAPSGIGYALENRAIVARLFPDALHDLHVRPLTPFCDALQHTLLASAPCGAEAPQLVLLTPGRFSETYFEHVFLARQLGVPLVEGGDLTVRHDRVFMKTVSGLRPVHAIWRRLDDDFSDPLELRADSTLGVPGLVRAWRAGHVLVANAFGLSLLESTALLGNLAAITTRLTGEPLALPVVPTRWCGDAAWLHAALDALPRSVIKPAVSSAAMEPVFGRDLDATALQAWRARIEANPGAYAIQQFVPLSQAPTWTGVGLDARAIMLRVFLLADGRGDYRVMPGGLSRTAGANRTVVSGHRGGGSKDTWVLSAAPGDMAVVDAALPFRATSGERLTTSRVAEHLFWLGRYAERSENAARLLRSVLTRLTEADALPFHLRPALWRTCLGQGLLGDTGNASGLHAADGSIAAVQRDLVEGIFDITTRHSLGFNVAQLDRVAGSVRDRLSSDNWRVLHGLFQDLTAQTAATMDLDDVLDTLDEAIVALVAIGGLEMAHMTRDDGWRFLSLGRHLERLAFVGRTIDDVAAEQATGEPALLEWLLDLSDSLITYRNLHLRRPEWTALLDLLLHDERNPRSAMFQVGKLAKHVRQLPDADLIDVLRDIDAVHQHGSRTRRHEPPGWFDGPPLEADSLAQACERLATRVSDALTLRYFSHVYELPRATVTR